MVAWEWAYGMHSASAAGHHTGTPRPVGMPVILNIPVECGSPILPPIIDHWREGVTRAAISGPLFFSPPEQPPSGPTWNCTSRCSSRFFDSSVFWGDSGDAGVVRAEDGHLTVGLAISPCLGHNPTHAQKSNPESRSTIQMWVKLQSKPSATGCSSSRRVPALRLLICADPHRQSAPSHLPRPIRPRAGPLKKVGEEGMSRTELCQGD